LLLLLIAGLLDTFLVLNKCGATLQCWPPGFTLAAGLCWCLDIMNCSIMMSENRPSFIIVPDFICESTVACWHNQHESFLHQWTWRARPPELTDSICTWRTASSRSFSRGADHRRRLRAARTSGSSRPAVLLLPC
tara:strand:- start:124 stop:528 length:405 start_codon:yes stop_codon:yes gene_type:complete